MALVMNNRVNSLNVIYLKLNLNTKLFLIEIIIKLL